MAASPGPNGIADTSSPQPPPRTQLIAVTTRRPRAPPGPRPPPPPQFLRVFCGEAERRARERRLSGGSAGPGQERLSDRFTAFFPSFFYFGRILLLLHGWNTFAANHANADFWHRHGDHDDPPLRESQMMEHDVLVLFYSL